MLRRIVIRQYVGARDGDGAIALSRPVNSPDRITGAGEILLLSLGADEPKKMRLKHPQGQLIESNQQIDAAIANRRVAVYCHVERRFRDTVR